MNTAWELAGLLAVPALCTWWTFAVARRKGRRPRLWAVCGLLFGPFAVVAVHVARDRRIRPVS